MCFDPVKATNTALGECQSLPAPLRGHALTHTKPPTGEQKQQQLTSVSLHHTCFEAAYGWQQQQHGRPTRPAYALAQEFQDLTPDSAIYGHRMGRQAHRARPCASGKQNRIQQAASLDNQLGTRLSKNGLPMFIQTINKKAVCTSQRNMYLWARNPHILTNLRQTSPWTCNSQQDQC